MITTDVKIEVVRKAVEAYLDLDQQWDELRKLSGASIDSPLGNAICQASANMITNAATIADDTAEILHWFILENECGKKRLKHSLPNSKRMIVVKDVATLLRVMGF